MSIGSLNILFYRKTSTPKRDFNEVTLRFNAANLQENIHTKVWYQQSCFATLRHGCSSVNLLHIFRIPFYKNTSGGLFLENHLSREYNFHFTENSFYQTFRCVRYFISSSLKQHEQIESAILGVYTCISKKRNP